MTARLACVLCAFRFLISSRMAGSVTTVRCLALVATEKLASLLERGRPSCLSQTCSAQIRLPKPLRHPLKASQSPLSLLCCAKQLAVLGPEPPWPNSARSSSARISAAATWLQPRGRLKSYRNLLSFRRPLGVHEKTQDAIPRSTCGCLKHPSEPRIAEGAANHSAGSHRRSRLLDAAHLP